jgi:hypothetical protein
MGDYFYVTDGICYFIFKRKTSRYTNFKNKGHFASLINKDKGLWLKNKNKG